MALKKNPPRKLRTQPLAFRFSEEAERILKVLALALNRKQVHILEDLLVDAYVGAKKKYGADIRAAELKLKEKTPR